MQNSEIRKTAEFLATETRRLADALRVTVPIGEEVEQKFFHVRRSRIRSKVHDTEVVAVIARDKAEAEMKAGKGWIVEEVTEVVKTVIF